jgi:DNA repair protein RecO (recombination protein O)
MSDPNYWPVLKGKHFLSVANFLFEDFETLQLSKSLLRFLLGFYLQDQVLTTRQILIDLKKI